MAHTLYSACERPDQQRAGDGDPWGILWSRYKRRGTLSPVSVAVRELRERYPESFAWRSEPALRRAIKVWFLRYYDRPAQRLAASITEMHNRPRGPVRPQLTPEHANELKQLLVTAQWTDHSGSERRVPDFDFYVQQCELRGDHISTARMLYLLGQSPCTSLAALTRMIAQRFGLKTRWETLKQERALGKAFGIANTWHGKYPCREHYIQKTHKYSKVQTDEEQAQDPTIIRYFTGHQSPEKPGIQRRPQRECTRELKLVRGCANCQCKMPVHNRLPAMLQRAAWCLLHCCIARADVRCGYAALHRRQYPFYARQHGWPVRQCRQRQRKPAGAQGVGGGLC
jgi:hypothetical protein